MAKAGKICYGKQTGTDYLSDLKKKRATERLLNRTKKSYGRKSLFLGVWERINNPDFYSLEFEGINNEAGRSTPYIQEAMA